MLAFAGGFFAMLALEIAFMWWRQEPPPAAASRDRPHPAPAAEPAEPEPKAPPVVATAKPAPPPAAPSRAPQAAPSRAEQPALSPSVGFTAPELKRDANGKLVPMIAADQLREVLPRAAPAIKVCLDQVGRRPSGKALLNFTVTAVKNKLVIETTGVQDPDTLADYPDLIECLHQTANLLVLDAYPVPEFGTPIYVRRALRVENGALAEDAILNFSYNP